MRHFSLLQSCFLYVRISEMPLGCSIFPLCSEIFHKDSHIIIVPQLYKQVSLSSSSTEKYYLCTAIVEMDCKRKA